MQDRLALEGDGESGGGAGEVERLAAAAAETGLNAADAAAAAAAVVAAELARPAQGTVASRDAPAAASPAADAPGYPNPILPPTDVEPAPVVAGPTDQAGVEGHAAVAGARAASGAQRAGAGQPNGTAPQAVRPGNRVESGAAETPAAASLSQPVAGDASVGQAGGDTGQVRKQAAGDAGGAPTLGVPPVLDALGKGLRRLVVAPPGMGRMREILRTDAPEPPADTPPRPNQTKAAPASVAMPLPPENAPAPAPAPVPAGLSVAVHNAPGAAPPEPTLDGLPAAASARSPNSNTNLKEIGAQEAAAADAQSEALPSPPVQQPPPPQPALLADGPGVPNSNILTLAGNSAGSSKARHGGSVYDLLIAEIKALKLAQKATPRALRDLRTDLDTAVSGLSAELADLRRRVAAAAEEAAAAAADAAEAAAAAAGRDPAGLGTQPRCAAVDGTALVPIGPALKVYEGFDPHGLAAELAALRAAAAAARRREAAFLALIAALMGCLAAGLLKGQGRRPRVRAAVVALAAANGLVGLLLHVAAWLPWLGLGLGLDACLPGGDGGSAQCDGGSSIGPGLPQCFVTV